MAPAEDRTSAKSGLVVGHRGLARIAPENTLASLDKAIEAGADASEFDVWPSADGKLVVMHEFNVERTTNGKKLLTKEVVDRLFQQKMTVWVYGVDEAARMDEMIAWGIRSVTTCFCPLAA
jgi:glycerophosphoryl diester phosphodiesterase